MIPAVLVRAACGTGEHMPGQDARPARAGESPGRIRPRYGPRSGNLQKLRELKNGNVRDGSGDRHGPGNHPEQPERSPALMQSRPKSGHHRKRRLQQMPVFNVLVLSAIVAMVLVAGAAAAPVAGSPVQDPLVSEGAATADAPGGSLYGLKIGLEGLSESFAPTAGQRIQRQVDHAGLRLDEAQAELDSGRTGTAQAALVRYRDTMGAAAPVATSLAARPETLSPARAGIDAQEQVLDAMLEAHAGDRGIQAAYADCVTVRSIISRTTGPSPAGTIPAGPALPTNLTATPTPTGTPAPAKTTTPAPTPTTTKTPTPTATATPSHPVPVVAGTVAGSTIQLSWNAITDADLQGYKVVVSKSQASPKYPDDGYMYWITDRYHNYATLDTTTVYTGGDIGGTLQPGQTYHISITAVYSGSDVAGNTITMVFPGAVATTTTTPAPAVPVVAGTVTGSTIQLSWNAITNADLQGYKVVVSKSQASPKYPDDGYMYWITDRYHNYATLDTTTVYNGGDIGGTLQPGQTYHISITAVYSGSKVAGNAITMVFPGAVATTATPTATATTATTATTAPPRTVPSVTAAVSGTTVVMHWNQINDADLIYYKIVVSKNSANPVYPADGYMTYYTDYTVTSTTLDGSMSYNGGDIGGKLQAGQDYYFSVTAVYKPYTSVAGNAVRLTFPGSPATTATTATPTATATTATATPTVSASSPYGAGLPAAFSTGTGVPAGM